MRKPVVLSRRRCAAIALLALSAIPLAACGNSRDQVLAEKVARAEAAATKAEEAAQKAERAARAAGARLNEVQAAQEDSRGDDAQASRAPAEAPVDTANASHDQNTDLATALNSPR